MGSIRENILAITKELPAGVELVAAAKHRTVEEVKEAIASGVSIIGENYVQEAETARSFICENVRWHCIGHLQKNKVKKAVALFDMIETVDSADIAREIDAHAAAAAKTIHVLIEVNSAHEPQKFGVMPGELEKLIRYCAGLSHIAIQGLMTMGPLKDTPEEVRPYFKETKRLFEEMRARNFSHVAMRYLSMGMSDTYRIAIEEGANMVRIGTKIFGPRK
jgi:hypothetical protein